MVHGLETLKRLNDEAAKAKKPTHALVYIAGVATGNTVFPTDRVLLFSSEEAAADFAIGILLRNEQISQDENTCEFYIGLHGESFDDAMELIHAWNNYHDGLLEIVPVLETN